MKILSKTSDFLALLLLAQLSAAADLPLPAVNPIDASGPEISKANSEAIDALSGNTNRDEIRFVWINTRIGSCDAVEQDDGRLSASCWDGFKRECVPVLASEATDDKYAVSYETEDCDGT